MFLVRGHKINSKQPEGASFSDEELLLAAGPLDACGAVLADFPPLAGPEIAEAFYGESAVVQDELPQSAHVAMCGQVCRAEICGGKDGRWRDSE